MPDVLYFIWALLPLLLLGALIKAAGKTVADVGTRESPAFFTKQLLYAVAAFILAIILDKTLYNSMSPLLTDIGIEPKILRWLLYPAILTLGAVIQQFVMDKQRGEEEAIKKARRMKYAPK